MQKNEQFVLTKEFKDKLINNITLKNENDILEQIGDMYAIDIAELFEELTIEQAQYLYTLLDPEKAADVLIELNEDTREKFLKALSSEEIAERFINNMDSDDAADLLSELSETKQQEVISHIEDIEQASDIVSLLSYDDGTAGSLMATELITVNAKWTVSQSIKELRKQAEEIDNIYTVYVVNDNDKLLGLLPLKKLILSSENTLIEDIYNPEIKSVYADQSTEEVAKIMEKYDLVVLPVIDKLGRLIGRITIDDVVDVIKEEADKDYQLMSGISGNVDTEDTLWVISKARLPWLLVALMGGIIGSQVIANYESQLQIHPEMAFFMPLIAAMGGNVGVQSSALVVQGLANHTLKTNKILYRLLREVLIGLFNGLICAVALLTYNIFFSHTLALSLTVSTALFAVIIFAALFGTMVPLILNKYKIDPALATGPFITTSNDIIGLFIYFMTGRILYGLL